MDPSDIYNFTHSSDMDGMSSAAFLVRYYGIPLENIFFVNYSGKQFDEMIKFLKSFKDTGKLLVISDFGTNKSTFNRFRDALSTFRGKGNSIMWFDHHLWDDERVNSMAKLCDFMVVGENHVCCGAELVYKFLCPHDKIADEIARITHLADFDPRLIKSEKDRALIDQMGVAINYLKGDEVFDNPQLRKVVKCISEGEIAHKFIRGAAAKYRKKAAPHLAKMMRTLTIIKEGKIKVAIGFGEHVQHQEACTRMFRSGANVVIYSAPTSGNTSVRSAPKIVSSGISFAFGGGGHPQASGFSVKRKDYDLSTKAGKEKFITKIKEMLKKKIVIRQ